MIIAVTVVNDQQESLRMELAAPWDSGINITDIDGIGAPEADIYTSEIVSADGDRYESSRAKSRKITLTLKPWFKPDIETSRQLTYKYFPVKKHVTLIFETDHRTLEIDGYVRSNNPKIFSKDEEITIEIDCPRPWFRIHGEPTSVILTGVEPLFEFPFSNEKIAFEPIEKWRDEIKHEIYDEFGRITGYWYEYVYHRKIWDDRTYDEESHETDGSRLIIHHVNDIDLTNWMLLMGDIRDQKELPVLYEGEADTGFVMEIHAALGTAKNIKIFNVNTGELFELYTDKIETITGEAFSITDTIYISTVSGDKYARLFRGGQWYNIINAVDKNSDWLIFRPGMNLIGYSAEEGQDNLEFYIQYTPLFQGV